jgi:HlyD family secretion protein
MRPTLILAALLAFAPMLPAQAQEAAAAESVTGAPAPALPAITVSTVVKKALSDRVIASGLIAAVEEIQVAPLVEGQPLDQLLVDVGDMVTEGQVLAVLSKTTLDLQKTEAVASLAAAKSNIAQAEAQLVEAKASRTALPNCANRAPRRKLRPTRPGPMPFRPTPGSWWRRRVLKRPARRWPLPRHGWRTWT